jgi:DNA-binding MarR family transcriptional regulator
MDIPLPSDTVFHTIESTIKEYRKFSQKNISNKINDITIDQGMILLYLNKYPELTQKEIASLVFKDNASMTRMVNLMVKKKYLKRSMNEQDRRRFKLEITSKGKEILVKLSLIISENRNISLNRITQKELQQLEIILNKIKFNLN